MYNGHARPGTTQKGIIMIIEYLEIRTLTDGINDGFFEAGTVQCYELETARAYGKWMRNNRVIAKSVVAMCALEGHSLTISMFTRVLESDEWLGEEL